MEQLTFEFAGGKQGLAGLPQVLGVVSSGNLEVMLEEAPLAGRCVVEVATSARGFATIWQAVLADFHARWQLRDVKISINDVGATPAVVALRLDQAVQASIVTPDGVAS